MLADTTRIFRVQVPNRARRFRRLSHLGREKSEKKRLGCCLTLRYLTALGEVGIRRALTTAGQQNETLPFQLKHCDSLQTLSVEQSNR